jgi:ParB-like chromosome segregation protein Spo0J
MAQSLKQAFQVEGISLKTSDIVPSKQINSFVRAGRKYRQIAASISEVGIIEPLVVFPLRGQSGKYMLLDGHLRLDVLQQAGVAEAPCLVSTEDEAYTYNKRVNRLATIQEHYMILKAIENGVSSQRIARALDVNIAAIRRKVNLLDGICQEAIDLLKNKHIPAEAFRILKKMKPLRQVEVAELLLAANNYSMPYMKALYAATSSALLLDEDKPKKVDGLSTEQMLRMEREIEGLQKDLKLIEESYGTEMLNLVLARAYLLKLMNNTRVVRYLAQNHADLLSALRTVVDSVTSDGQVSEAEAAASMR